MKILHTEASCGWGGQEIRILTEARGMIGRGHQVELLCPAEARIFVEAPAYGVPVRALPIGRKNLKGLFALRRFLQENRFDVVNTHSSTDSWLAALACRSLAGAPPVVRTRHLSTPVNTSWTTRWLYEKGCAHVAVTGEALKKELVSHNGFPADHLTSVPTGIDTARFCPRDRASTRAALGLPIDTVYVGILATLRDWKGHTVLFEALAQMLPERPDLRLLVIGDGPYRDRLDTKAAALGITQYIDFVGHRNDAELWLAALDVFTLPSWGDEGVSQALMQAMACALPIVTTPVGSLTEVIHDGSTGLIVPPRDSVALAAAIKALLDDPDLASRLGKAARELAEVRCGEALMLDRMEAIFRRFGRPGAH